MTVAFDPRLVKIIIDVGNGKLKTYEGNFAIKAQGVNYANQLQNECTINIYNLDKDTQNYILTATSPFNYDYSPKYVRVEAGRKSYGYHYVFEGNIVTSTVSQPPDIGVTLNCLTGNYPKGDLVVRMQGGRVPLSVLAKQIAQDFNVQMQFQATDKEVPNYQHSGDVASQIKTLNTYGGINAFIDNGVLVVKDGFVPLTGTSIEISEKTGLLGIPTYNELGLRVRFFINPKAKLGVKLVLNSKIYPAMNGDYIINKLEFDIESRGEPFYYTAYCTRMGY